MDDTIRIDPENYYDVLTNLLRPKVLDTLTSYVRNLPTGYADQVVDAIIDGITKDMFSGDMCPKILLLCIFRMFPEKNVLTVGEVDKAIRYVLKNGDMPLYE